MDLPQEAIGPLRSNWTQRIQLLLEGGPSGCSIPIFLRQRIATFDFPGGVSTPCTPSGSAQGKTHTRLVFFFWFYPFEQISQILHTILWEG